MTKDCSDTRETEGFGSKPPGLGITADLSLWVAISYVHSKQVFGEKNLVYSALTMPIFIPRSLGTSFN